MNFVSRAAMSAVIKRCLLFAVSFAATWVGSLQAASLSTEAWQFTEIHSFGFPEYTGLHPAGRLLLASDAVFYGLTKGLGSPAATLFRIQPGGAGYRVVHRFPRDMGGQEGVGGLKEGPDGRLFGVTQNSGFPGVHSAVFSIRKDGSDFRVLHRMTNAAFVGGELVVSTNGVFGLLYENRGSNGAVFRVAFESGYAELHSLPALPGSSFFSPHDGMGLVSDEDGVLFGVSLGGGAADKGMVFRLNQDGSNWRVLHEFGLTPGDNEHAAPAALLRASDGSFYGLTESDHILDRAHLGRVFRVSKDGDYQAIYSFSDALGMPVFRDLPLTEARDGRLYGSSLADIRGLVSQIYRLGKDGSGFEVIYESAVGEPGISTVAEAPDGMLYATSLRGTTTNDIGNHTGSIFRIAPDGSGFSVVHKFSASGGDGQRPLSGLLAASDGMLYGTTLDGGKDGHGTVFRLNRDGTGYEVLRDFFRDHPNGWSPAVALVEDGESWLYGTTTGTGHGGTVFRLRRDGSELQTIRRFVDTGGDGYIPSGGLVRDSNGVLYGTTQFGSAVGGARDFGEAHGLGTVFRLNSDGSGYQLLHSFGDIAGDGRNPALPLLLGNDDRLYGMTTQGGQADRGVIFRLTRDGTDYQILKSFSTNAGQPFEPNGGLLQTHQDTLIGTTIWGGLGFGTIFQLKTDGSGFRVLHAFTGEDGQGRYPHGGLARGADGALYGTAYASAQPSSRILFRLQDDGTGYQVLLNSIRTSGWLGFGLASGRDAALYGVSQGGGEMGFGTVFRLMPPDYIPRFVAGTTRRSVTGEFTAQVIGAAGQEAELEASADLRHFSPVLPLRFTDEPLSFVLPATNRSYQTYRVRVR